ncbi:hypothetical protein H0H92_004646 [Tricholoma furcatifolium]|nr:hypothetical protein H0H92_004646 [Tricholoma furcatifolium]
MPSHRRRCSPGRSLTNLISTLSIALFISHAPQTAYSSTTTAKDSVANGDFGTTVPMVFGAARQLDDPRAHVYRKPQVPLEVDNYHVAPEGLKLEQVHVYVRHAVTNNTEDGFLRARQMVERADGTTAEGEWLGFLSDKLLNTNEVYFRFILYIANRNYISHALFRSTNMPRTIASLQQVIHGLYPQEKCDLKVLPNIFVRNGKDENLLGNTSASAAAAYNPTLQRLDVHLSKYLNGNPVRVDGKPRASGIMDTIRAAIAHGIKVPPEFQDKAIVDTLETAIVNEWFAVWWLDKTEEVRRLGMGRLLDDLTRKMQHKVDNGARDPLKVLIHSTHDTALAALCSTLDVFDEQWPAFTASITFELFKGATQPAHTGNMSLSQTVLSNLTSRPGPEYYIRMRYQNKNMALPACAEEGKYLPGSPEFCTLTAFQERVKELTPEDFEAECAPAGRFGI